MVPDSTQNDSRLTATVAEVSERAALLVREEIELAKAEMVERGKKLAKGAIVGMAAGVFIGMSVVFFLWGGAWGLWSLIFVNGNNNVWAGFYIIAGALLFFGLGAGFMAAKALRSGSPPKPEMAMEEARRIRETVEESRHGQGAAG